MSCCLIISEILFFIFLFAGFSIGHTSVLPYVLTLREERRYVHVTLKGIASSVLFQHTVIKNIP